jgi:DNA modification methylase
MEIRLQPISELIPYARNARTHSEAQISEIAASIVEFGFTNPVLADSTGIVAGHGRVLAARQLFAAGRALIAVGGEPLPAGLVPVIDCTGWSDAQRRAYILADNRLAERAGWDGELLALELSELSDLGFDLGLAGFSDADLAELLANGGGRNPLGGLVEQFLIAPFSVFNARDGWWQERKSAWIALGIQSEVGRGENLLRMSDTILEPDPDKRAAMQEARAEAARANKLLPGGAQGPNGKYTRGRKADAKAYNTSEWVARKTAEGDLANIGDQSGTSIFDPVLCEIAYRWFCPPDGRVPDPFAGGSVRGIVAAALGRRYAGIELSGEQIDANRAQWNEIGTKLGAFRGEPPLRDGLREVRVSAAMLRQLFHPCDPAFIADVCHAHCCESSTSRSGIMVTIHPKDLPAIAAAGGVVRDGLLQPRRGEKKCPFKTPADLCGLHGTSAKPFGCIASPFTFNNRGKLVVRNRYRVLKCFKAAGAIPAYQAHRGSLELIFGKAEAARIAAHLDAGCGDLTAMVSDETYRRMAENDAIKQGALPQGEDDESEPAPAWHCGDSREVLARAGDADPLGEAFDFVFSCPPYGDLERYSDDPADLSAMTYADFCEAYAAIIAGACARLKPDRFACFVVGEIRDKRGAYRDFIGDTVQAFRDAGLAYYNEAILVTQVGSLPIRAGKQFSASRKLGKTHQNVLVFVKGDGKRAAQACGLVDCSDALAGIEPDA